MQQIVKEDLGKRKISAKMVPRILTHDQKRHWLHISSDLLRNAEMFDRVIRGDKTWCFQQIQKQNDRACSGKYRIHLSRKKHACLVRRSRPCLCVSLIIIHYEFTAQGQTVNQVLSGSADKVTGICLEEKTRNLV